MAAVTRVAWLLAILPLALAAQDHPVSDGVYTAAQAERGKAAYAKYCSRCHGEDLAGRRDYPLSGERFMDRWEAHNLQHLFVLIRDSMPPDGINAVDVSDKRDVVAYLLQQNGFPAGSTELPSDAAALATYPIERSGGRRAATTGSLVAVTGCLAPHGEREWALTDATEPEKTALPTPGVTPTGAAPSTSGTREIGLLNVFPVPAAHRGHTMRAVGFLIKAGAIDAINVVSLDMIAPACATPPLR
jgi:mono/diheme cytochrome c family protein